MLVPSNTLRESLELRSRTYAEALHHHAGAQEYLKNHRKLTRDNVLSFRLGVVTEPLKGDEDYEGRLCIPYLTRAGVVTLRFRRLPTHNAELGEWVEPRGPKYLSLPGDEPRLFNVEALFQRGDTIAICEGEFDTMVTDRNVKVPAVGIQGVSTWRKLFTRFFEDYEHIFIMEDHDFVDTKTGRRPGSELTRAIREDLNHAVPVRLPEGYDVSEYVAEFGSQSLRERMGIADDG